MAKTDMLEDEFLMELRRIKGWGITWSLLRRTRWPRECPITAVANALIGSHFTTPDWQLAAWAIGLPAKFARQVVLAADNEPKADPKLRARLFKACEIKP